jgi:hypothetical protein
MDGLILFYTNCLLPKPLLKESLRRASAAAGRANYGLIVSSHLPVSNSYTDCSVDFDGLVNEDPGEALSEFMDVFSVSENLGSHAMNLVTGLLVYSPETIVTQIVHALEVSNIGSHLPVVLWEHDVMYPEEYVGSVSAQIRNGVEFVLYHDHVFADRFGYFKPNMHFWHLSRYSAQKGALYAHFGRKLKMGSTGVLEPVPREFYQGDGDQGNVVDSYAIVRGKPVLDIKHGANASGQFLIDNHREKDPEWGNCCDSVLQYLLDEEYDTFLERKPDVGYGLFTTSSASDW